MTRAEARDYLSYSGFDNEEIDEIEKAFTRKGTWEIEDAPRCLYHCSECGKLSHRKDRYCVRCGTKMEDGR